MKVARELPHQNIDDCERIIDNKDWQLLQAEELAGTKPTFSIDDHESITIPLYEEWLLKTGLANAGGEPLLGYCVEVPPSLRSS